MPITLIKNNKDMERKWKMLVEILTRYFAPTKIPEKIDSMEKENEDNLKICESLKSNYESKLINKDNLINDLENSIEYNDGSSGQVLETNGSGVLSFATASSGISTGKAIAMAIVFG